MTYTLDWLVDYFLFLVYRQNILRSSRKRRKCMRNAWGSWGKNVLSCLLLSWCHRCMFVCCFDILKSQLNQCSSRKENSGGKKVQRDSLKNIKGPLTPHGLWYRHERMEFLRANPGVSVIAVNQSNVICSRLVFLKYITRLASGGVGDVNQQRPMCLQSSAICFY